MIFIKLNTFAQQFAPLIALEGSLAIYFGNFLLDDFVDFLLLLLVHFALNL